MELIINLMLLAIAIVELIVIIWAIITTLANIGVINRYNNVVVKITSSLGKIVEPMLQPIRRFIRPVNGIDLSPLVLIIGLWILQNLIIQLIK